MQSGPLTEPRVTSYPYVQNRLVVIDWASLSYHLMFSMKTPSAKKMLGLMGSDDELLRWRNLMFQRVLDYVTLFNPRHIIFALEGKNGWRKKFVKDYYSAHTEVYVDKEHYYVCSDNYCYAVKLLSVDDEGNQNFQVDSISVKNRKFLTEQNLKHVKLGRLPKEKQDMLWAITTDSGKPIIPSYKGQRKSKEWPFFVEKSFWMNYKDEFAKAIAPAFRARAVMVPEAEGDDIVYASVQKYAGSCDDVIIITRDSDRSQIDVPNVKIFNHVSETFTKCAYPKEYLDAKVLSGDKSDNIQGMAFIDEKTGKMKPEKANQLGEGTALTLLEKCPAIYTVAKENGWDDQYMRNRTLIDLSLVPEDLKPVFIEAVSCPEPERCDDSVAEPNGISENRMSSLRQLRSFGFYALNDKAVVDADPSIFRAELYRKEAASLGDNITEEEIASFDNIDMFAGPGVSFTD